MAKNKKEQQQEQNKERPAEEAAEPKQEAAPESKGSKIKAKKEDGEKEKQTLAYNCCCNPGDRGGCCNYIADYKEEGFLSCD